VDSLIKNLYFIAGQSFGQGSNGGLNGGYFSNPPSNNIGGSDANVGSHRQNGGNNGYQY